MSLRNVAFRRSNIDCAGPEKLRRRTDCPSEPRLPQVASPIITAATVAEVTVAEKQKPRPRPGLR
jgi:hypothetical protein